MLQGILKLTGTVAVIAVLRRFFSYLTAGRLTMKEGMKRRIGQAFGRAIFVMICAVLTSATAHAQSGGGSGGNAGSCMVTRLRLRIATSNDDLRGGQDNLNIIVYFASGAPQAAPNVNHGQNWPNNSVNMVDIQLNRPVPPDEIRALRFIHIADGGINWGDLASLATPAAPINIPRAFLSPDNWNMADAAVSAIGNGVGVRIASYGFHRFTGSDPDLVINTKVPANACGSGRPTGNSGQDAVTRGLNPGGSGLRSVTGSGPGNSGSTEAGRTLEPLIPRDRSSSGSGIGSGTGELHKLNPPPRMAVRPLTAKMKAKLGPPKKGQPIQNTRVLQASSAIALVLQRQRQGADAELSRMANVVARPPAQPNMLGQHSQLMSANGQRAAVPAAQSQATPAITDGTKSATATQPQTNRPMLAAPTTAQMAPRTGSVGNIGPSQTSSATVNSAGASPLLRSGAASTQPVNGVSVNGTSGNGNSLSSMAHLTYGPSESIAIVCAQNSTMRIMNVSGSSSPATFTPVAQYNFYTITGCSFGNIGPNARVYIYKGATFHEDFQIQEWNDNWVKLNLDPNLSGLLDQDNLTLVLQRADGQQATQTGFKFYAAREKRLLNQIPSSDFGLYGLTLVDTSKWSQSYTSPGSTAGGYGFGGMTAEVAISEGLPFIYDNDFETPQTTPSPGTDIYDLSHLQPGFAPTEADISWDDMDCSPGDGTLITSGSFSGEFNGAQLWINFPGENCSHMRKPGSFSVTDVFTCHCLIYGLDVWVEGPRGVDPWTGLPR